MIGVILHNILGVYFVKWSDTHIYIVNYTIYTIIVYYTPNICNDAHKTKHNKVHICVQYY